jgi:hypothetical protein
MKRLERGEYRGGEGVEDWGALLSVSCQVNAKFGTGTIVGLNGTLVEAKRFIFTLECTHFIFNKCPIYTHNGANAKFNTNWDETDYSVDM